jgi:type VI secretion system protein
MMVSVSNPPSRRRLAAALALLPLVLLSACGGNRPSFFGGDIKVAAAVDAGANQNNPIAVEVVVVYDKALLQELLKLPAAKWFAQREQYKKDHPDDEDFVSWYWEWVPGQEVKTQEISFGTGARAGLVFADYLTGQENRVRFDPHQDVRIHLQEEGFTVEPMP